MYAFYDLSRYETDQSRDVQHQTAQKEAVAQRHIAEQCLSLNYNARVACIREQFAATRETERSEQDLKAQNNMARVAYWMWAIAWIQALVGVGGIYLVKRTLDVNSGATAAAVKAAESAAFSARAAVAIEQPILRCYHAAGLVDPAKKEAMSGSRVTIDAPQVHCVFPGAHLRNHGRTVARPYEIVLGRVVTPRLSGLPDYGFSRHIGPESVIPQEPTNPPFYASAEAPIHITHYEMNDIADGQASLWIFFALRYRDFMDARHEWRFCFEYRRVDDRPRFRLASESDIPAEYIGHRYLDDPEA